jgi:aldehyde:ferredoxin oxidoreductase
MAQARGGYVGKILILDLTARTSEVIDSEPYQQYGGGHGMGTALFWEYCRDKTVGPFDPGNVVTLCSSPFSGTPVPSSSGRVEIQGIGSKPLPTWFVRSNIGGRIPMAMKACGYDAVVITGAADSPLWVSVINDEVRFNDARHLWGLLTNETQERIWDELTGGAADGEWYSVHATRDGGRSTQKPSVMCIGPTAENLGSEGTITHDAGHHAGQSGLGAVWGSKNLKAISFLGTGSVPVADPQSLLDLRVEFQKKHSYNVDDPVLKAPSADGTPAALYGFITRQPGFNGIYWNTRDMLARPSGCQGCTRNCRRNTDTGVGNETMCAASLFYMAALPTDKSIMVRAADYMNKLGINGFETELLGYLRNLYMMGVLGPGEDCQIKSELPWDQFGNWTFIEAFLNSIAYRTDIGADLADGVVRASMKWGRWEEDSTSGLLRYPQWGYHYHYDPRTEVDWSYGSMFGDRDINEHGYNWHVHWMPLITSRNEQPPLVSAQTMAEQMAKATGLDDPMCFDYSEDGIYSDAKLRSVAWHRHYGRFWVQSMNMCDWVWPHLIEYAAPDLSGDLTGATSPDPAIGFEPRYYRAVTGLDITFEESIELGHRIFTFDRAIWCLQGRTPEMEVFAEFVYRVPTTSPDPLPVFRDGAWKYDDEAGRTLDRARFEDVKHRFYELEGWDRETGVPTRATLEGMNLGFVADELEKAGLL